MNDRDGTWLTAAGIVPARQRPGSAKGVMFIALEDELGIANLVVWPKVFEAFRRTVLASTTISVKGRVQREGEVVHLVAHQLTDSSGELAAISEQGRFSLEHGRGDEVSHGGGGPDSRERPPPPRDIYIPDLNIDRSR